MMKNIHYLKNLKIKAIKKIKKNITQIWVSGQLQCTKAFYGVYHMLPCIFPPGWFFYIVESQFSVEHSLKNSFVISINLRPILGLLS